ncbi:MAG: HAMP domain-containing histidine kinase [Conexibacteraceae bacterium]|nr:HAMP domain-containing histidine kinase [Conexibacteraceae bacterium]
MNVATRVNSRITRLAVGRHLPHRTARVRLTLLYGGLFLLSGAALVAITYALFQQATEYSKPHLPNIPHAPAIHQLQLPELPHALSQLTQDQQQLAQARNLFVQSAPKATAGAHLVMPPVLTQGEHQLAHDQHRLAQAVNQLAGAVHQVAHAGSVQAAQRAADSHQLLVNSGIALAIMAVLAVLAGWLVAGRVLHPLEDSYRAQRQFVANASHELRAPLTRQRTLIEVALASSAANFASLRQAHERVLASEQHLEQLIDALLALTRGQAGLERRERSDLAVLATRALQAQRPDLERLNLDVDASLDPAPTAGDPRLLERLITNLIDNATRHNTPGGRVEIATGTRDRHAFLSISNTGLAVPPEQIPRLFQPFERLVDTRTRHNDGHGLGLSIVEAIANAHGAEITARARPEGGLTIELLFPPATGARARVALPARTKRGSPETSLPPG